MKLFLSHTGVSEVAGGVERYAQYLSEVFPSTKHLDYHSHKKEFGDGFSLLREPIRAKKLGGFVSKNYSNVNTIFTNGMFCWNLKEKNQINICHGTYAAFAEKALSKTNPDYFRLKYIYSYFEKKAAKNASKVIVNSKSTAQSVKKYFGLSSEVIYPPVDFENFKPMDFEKARENLGWAGVNVLFVGRAEKAKGFDLVESVAEKNPNISFKCILSRHYNSKVKNIEIISPKKHALLPLYYNAADLVLFPSRFEGFGFVTIEALACNKKIVTLGAGIASEIESENLFVTIESELNKTLRIALSNQNSNSRNLMKNVFSVKKFREKWRSACE